MTGEFPPKMEKIKAGYQKLEDLKKIQSQLFTMSEQMKAANEQQLQQQDPATRKLIANKDMIDHEILSEPRTQAQANPMQNIFVEIKEINRRLNNLELSQNQLRTKIDALEGPIIKKSNQIPVSR